MFHIILGTLGDFSLKIGRWTTVLFIQNNYTTHMSFINFYSCAFVSEDVLRMKPQKQEQVSQYHVRFQETLTQALKIYYTYNLYNLQQD